MNIRGIADLAATAGKVVITVLVLVLCAWHADWREIAQRIATMRALPAALALAPFLLIPVFGGLRWWLALKGLGQAARLATAVSLFSVAQVVSQALPLLAGDGCRAWLAARRGWQVRAAIHSIVLERACMVAALLGVLVATRPLLATRIDPAPPLWIGPLLLIGLLVGGGVLLLADRLPIGHSRLGATLMRVAGDTRRVVLSRWGVALILTSVASNLNFAVAANLLADALSLPMSLADCLAFIPLVTVATTLPVSLGGWGVREGLLVLLLSAIGIATSDALALSLLFGICGAASGAPGMLAWWLRQQPVPRSPLPVMGG